MGIQVLLYPVLLILSSTICVYSELPDPYPGGRGGAHPPLHNQPTGPGHHLVLCPPAHPPKPADEPPHHHGHPPALAPAAQSPKHHHHRGHHGVQPPRREPAHAPGPIHNQPAGPGHRPVLCPPAHPPKPADEPPHHHGHPPALAPAAQPPKQHHHRRHHGAQPPRREPAHAPGPHDQRHHVNKTTRVAVQGVVYCNSCTQSPGLHTNATAFPGATVKLECSKTKPASVVISKTDMNGYFYITAPEDITRYGALKFCKVSLVTSSNTACNKPSNLHGGDVDAPLKKTAEKDLEDDQGNKVILYTVGPFAFEPKCPK